MAKVQPNKREVPPHLTYMIVEAMLDTAETALSGRGYGLGQRDPSKVTAEGQWERSVKDRNWRHWRKWSNSCASVGVKY